MKNLFEIVKKTPCSVLTAAGCAFILSLAGCSNQKLSDLKQSPLDEVKNYILASQKLEKEALSHQDHNPLLPHMAFESVEGIEIPSLALSVQAENMPIKDFYMSLVEGSQLNMVIDPDVAGEISLVVHQMPLEDILNVVEEQYGFAWEKQERGYKITANNAHSKTYNISYLAISRSSNSKVSLDASRIASEGNSAAHNTEISTTTQTDILTELRTSLDHLIADDRYASYEVNRTSGLFVLKAYPKTHKRVEAFLKKLNESLHHQVLIEAKILEVKLFDSYNQGIDWSSIFEKGQIAAGQVGSGNIVNTELDSRLGATTGAIANLTGLNPAADGSSPATNAFESFLWDSFQSSQMGGMFKIGIFKNHFKFVLDLLAGQGQVQVLSSPRITTLNNQKAIIRVGEEKKFVSEVSGGSTTNTGSGSETTDPTITFETYFSGISLVVMPHIIDDQSLILHVHPSISDITEEKKNYNLGGKTYEFFLPKNNIRESDSIIKVHNEQIVVLGGLMESQHETQKAQVPILDQISAFDHTKERTFKSELVILIKPVILTASSHEEIVQKQRETLQSFEKILPFKQ